MIVLPDWLPLPGKIRQRRALRVVDALIWDLIRRRRTSTETRGDMLGQMLAAAEGIGFFYIRNHGVPDRLMSGLFDVSRTFFAAPAISGH